MRYVPLKVLGLTVAVVLLGALPATAEVVKGKWYFGAGLSFHTTMDSIRSSAADGDRADPRPSRLKNRETSLEDTVRYDVVAGFGLTDLVSIQLDAGYYRGSVDPVQGFVTSTFPSPNTQIPGQFVSWVDRDATVEVVAGDLTEIPVTLSGLVRFRTDRAVNPYVGAGLGMIFTEFDASGELESFNARLGALRIRALLDKMGNELTPEDQKVLKGDGRVSPVPLVVDVEDTFQWHLATGIEYFFNDNVSLVVDARYRFAQQDVTLLLGGEEQIDFLIFAEQMFRPDGSLRYFGAGGAAPNPYKDPSDPSLGRVGCNPNTIGDFDQDGHADDLCYPFNLTDSFRGNDDPFGEFLVQGGSINLSGYTIAMSVRVYF